MSFSNLIPTFSVWRLLFLPSSNVFKRYHHVSRLEQSSLFRILLLLIKSMAKSTYYPLILCRKWIKFCSNYFPDTPSISSMVCDSETQGILTGCPWWGPAQITQSAIFPIATYYLTAGEWGLLLAGSEPRTWRYWCPTPADRHGQRSAGGQQPSHTAA